MERIKRTQVLIVLLIGICMVQCTPKNEPMSIFYTDQNNNSYSISENSFRYMPITEAESSSGTYNGGDKVSKEIPTETFDAILLVANTLIEANKNKDIKREMMTSMLSVKKGDSTTRVTLRKSKMRSSLEALLIAVKER